MAIDGTHLIEIAIDDLVRRLPSILVALASAWAILRRSERRLEQHVDQRVHQVEQLVDGRMSEMKELLVEKGKYEGLKEAIPMAREDRKEFLEALKTPTTVDPVKAPPAPPK